MTDLLAARIQMASSLAFHIIFAVVGIGMPLLMVIAEWLWMKTGKPVYLELAKRWAKGTAIMFAVGAVSGTLLSFELGLLWPKFMEFSGAIIGLPFSLEGFAFFLEAIFLGIYLYGWNRVSKTAHWLAGVMVCLCGALSGVFVVTVNAWMNVPRGFEVENGVAINIDPIAAMLNPASFTQTLHMTIAAFQALAFAVVAIHAWALLKRPGHAFHWTALKIALPVAVVTSLLQPISGDLSAKMLAKHQKVKLAALEGHWETETYAPLRIGGWPDPKTGTTPYSIEIPGGLSFLAYGDPAAEVMGLNDVPPSERPPVRIVHAAFQIMVGAGMFMMASGLIAAFLAWRRRPSLQAPWFLKLLIANGPLGFLAIQAGWIVTEVGRQPWVVHGVLRTSDAVTPMPYLWVGLVAVLLVYLLLGTVVVYLLKKQVFATLEEA